MLSARGEIEQRVEVLNAGTDDHLPKPVATPELLAGIRSLVRRHSRLVLLTVGAQSHDPMIRQTRRADRHVGIPSHEALLLDSLLKAEGEVVPLGYSLRGRGV
jgi:DNA-binding response OmpR family regulator